MVGVNVIAADTDAEARRLFTSPQQSSAISFAEPAASSARRSTTSRTTGPPPEKAHASRMLACSFVGSPATVSEGLERFIAETSVDELIVASAIYEHAARVRSYEEFLAEGDGTERPLIGPHPPFCHG